MSGPVHVTDHAVLRYLEREHGLDVDAVRAHLAGRAVNAVRLGALAVSVGKVKLVLRDGVIVTAIRTDWPTKGDQA